MNEFPSPGIICTWYKKLQSLSAGFGVAYLKCHTLGNDFILAEENERSEALLPSLCQRKTGIGADDVVLYRHLEGHIYRMRVINPDGSNCAVCGNALISLGTFIHYSTGVSSMRLQTPAGEKGLAVIGSNKTVNCSMGKIGRVPMTEHRFQLDGVEYEGWHIDVGVPHVVLLTSELDSIPISLWGRGIERDLRFPLGTNVMFAQVVGMDEVRLRCWERGGTGETLACGTGACATAIICARKKMVGNKVRIRFPHGEHRISMNGTEVTMQGRAMLVSCGLI